jgi:hypothetical protein
MRNHKKHKLKSKINKAIRVINKNIAEDNLWKGRFVVLNRAMWMHEYEDKSGVYAVIRIAAFDKKTGKYEELMMDEYDVLGYWGNGSFKLWNFINDFIVDKVKVWSENPSPRDKDFVVDYTKVPVPQI